MGRIVALERERYLASTDRTTWRVQLACGASYTLNTVGSRRLVVGSFVYCTCAVCTRGSLDTTRAPPQLGTR